MKINKNNGPNAEDRALDKFAEIMIEKINTLQNDWKKPWFTESSMVWPKNLSGRDYNGMNALLLMMHCEKEGYKIPVFMTFDRVSALNYTKDKQGKRQTVKDENSQSLPLVAVLKGQKAFPVFITTFTVVNKESKEKIKYDDYKQLSDEERAKYNVYPKLNVYNVFNVDQTNLKESRPDLYKKLEEENVIKRPENTAGQMFQFPAVDQMIVENKWICPIKNIYGDNAYYSISKNEIVIPEKKQFKDGESYYSNLFHEMSHSTGAENHLDRLKPTSFGSKEYAREELVAELTAALVSQRYGITKHLKEDSASYLKSWLSSLKESPDFLKSTLTDVKKSASMITQKVDAIQLDIETKEEKTNEQQIQTEPEIYDIPQWALPYLFNGEDDALTDKEKELVDKFISEKFPNGFIPEFQEGTKKELNLTPAFGIRNENALTNRGESAYEAVDTISVKFYDFGYTKTHSEGKINEVEHNNDKESIAAKAPPSITEEFHYHRGR